jgi:N-carbamoylputrescine amidase
MQGHAVSNCMPVIAANRIGEEDGPEGPQKFYGHSFVTDQWGDLIAEVEDWQAGAIVATVDLVEARMHRAGMGFFRDRRPQLYGRLAEDI